jgi:putative DNA primase/helicase
MPRAGHSLGRRAMNYFVSATEKASPKAHKSRTGNGKAGNVLNGAHKVVPIDAAEEPAPQVTKPSASTRRSRANSDDIDDAAEDGLPPGYTLAEAGLYYREPPGDDEKPARPQWIAGPHEVLGHARDTTSNNWGLVLRWYDRAGVQHIWCVPVGLAYGTGGELSAGFASQGLACATSASGKERLRTYIARHRPPRLVTAVTATGWFRDSFVLADRTIIGPNQDEVFLQTPHGAADQAYAQAGDLDQWKSHVAAYAIGNHHLALAITTALSGPLYHLINEPNGGWQLVGDSRSGKSTILAAAASVWGPPTPAGFLSSWRATSNGLESMCAARCDTALILDEIGQADPRDVGAAIYMICNGAGKSRADRTGAGRPPQTWRLPLLSSGEKTLGQMMEQAGLSVAAGQDVRLPVIRPALGAAHGWFQDLHGEMSGAGLSDVIRQGARDYHGTAGREFARKLIEARHCDPDELLDQIKRTMADFLSEENVAGADGQGTTVARRFALCAAAGELAIRFGVLPWPVGEANKAMHACYRAWVAERGGAGTSEAHRAVEQVRGFIERFGVSRFEAVGGATKQEGEVGHRAVLDRVGYRQMAIKETVAEGLVVRTTEVVEYDVLPNAWREVVCKGLDPKAAARALHDAGYLIAPPPEPDRKFRPNGSVTINNQSLRLYRIKGSIIHGEP